MELELGFREDCGEDERDAVYRLAIEADRYGRPYVARESMKNRGQELSFLFLREGKGFARNSDTGETDAVELDTRKTLGLAVLGNLKQYPRLSSLRRYIEGWQFSAFGPDTARNLSLVTPQKRLNTHGDNLANVVLYKEREHPTIFRDIQKELARMIPGIEAVDTKRTADGKLLLRFHDKSFETPLYARDVSDATLKLLACLTLLHMPEPAPFLCIEDPDRYLHHRLLVPRQGR